MCGFSNDVPLTGEQVAAIEADPENPMNWCCAGAAMNGPRGCSCWRAVYSKRRRAPRATGELGGRTSPCTDCAYRSGSAEFQDEDERSRLLSMANTGSGAFVCHEGMAHTVRWRHPRGMVVEAGRDEVGAINTWAPRYRDAQTPCKASGAPADLCFGWLTRRLRAS